MKVCTWYVITNTRNKVKRVQLHSISNPFCNIDNRKRLNLNLNYFKCKKFLIFLSRFLKVQSYKLYNNKYMIALIQITNTEILGLIASPISKLLSRKVLFINKEDNRNC